MQTSCLFLRPEITTLEDREKQRQDITNIIVPAIVQAKLSPIDDRIEGFEVFNISDEMVQKAYQADILIIDANCYETSGLFKLSPYLYYYMAIGHSRGNATILLANTTGHLPHTLIKYHTLTYSSAGAWRFITEFASIVEGIRQQHNSRPDNPIQDYFSQEELANARRQRAEIEVDKVLQKQGKRPPIIFRPVEKDWE